MPRYVYLFGCTHKQTLAGVDTFFHRSITTSSVGSHSESTWQIIFSQQMMLLPGIFCAKTSLFLLFAQIFNIKDDMKIAIRIGLVINFLLYFTGIPVEAYYQAPGIGQKWETLMLTGKQRHAIYWGLVQSAVAIVLDFYIFILPLPVIAQLRISSRKQAKLGAIFSTAFV